MAVTVTSPAFAAGKPIPKKHTGEGPDVSPALAWSGVPAGARELALICDDPDAPRKDPWVHWVLYQIPAGCTGLPEKVGTADRPAEIPGAVQGMNDFGRTGYGGPMPPPGHGIHHYHFTLYALNAELSLPPGATKAQVLAATKGKVLAQGELVGTYQR